ncbi:MAG: DUF2059 domain-containing protein [Sphingomicrobium sp.]
MIRTVAGIFLPLTLIASTGAFATPPAIDTPMHSAATPATPVRMELAKELVGYTQPKELMLHAVLTGWEKGVAEQDEDYQADLEAIQPGLGAKLAERGKAELVTLVAEQIPQMHERLAALFAGNCTEEELKSLIAFYSSPAGAKMIRSITMSDSGEEAFDDEQLTTAEATSANRKAAKEAVKLLDGDEWLAAVKFSVSPGGRVVKALGPQVQAISAEWMTRLMADFGKRIESITEEMVKRAVEEADKMAGDN